MSDQTAYIAACCLHDPDCLSIPIVQTEHRLKLANGWPIQTGSKVLEIGCGQGDCTG
jgi:cyclopropane fatty-acyl-phospholipid synthase-like methyltransferase